jgi:hypothetical protein
MSIGRLSLVDGSSLTHLEVLQRARPHPPYGEIVIADLDEDEADALFEVGAEPGCDAWIWRSPAPRSSTAGPVSSMSTQSSVVCERIGHPLCQREHDADRWVAATALPLGISPVSNDRIFEDAPGMMLEAAR